MFRSQLVALDTNNSYFMVTIVICTYMGLSMSHFDWAGITTDSYFHTANINTCKCDQELNHLNKVLIAWERDLIIDRQL